MESEPLPRKLAAILYADVAGYSRLTGEDEDATHRRLGEYLDQIAVTIERYGGRVMHYAGDAVLAMFGAVVDTLSCAAQLQLDLKARNEELPDERKVQFRIGVNLGDVIEDRGDIYGDGVNVAARLESLAEPGGICISESVHTAVGSRLPLDYEFMGEQAVKNIAKPVKAYHARVKPGAVLAEPSVRPKPRRPTHAVMAATAAAVVLVIGAGVIAWWQPWQPREEPASVERMAFPLPDKPSIAVLPFTNMSDGPKQEYFVDGMTDDLITDLSKLSGLFVISRNSTFTYKGKPVNVRQVAEELGVRYVLEGSVRRVGGQVRINAQLIDAIIGGHVWADRYDGTMTDIFALQDRVTQNVVSALKVQLTPEEEDQQTRGTDNAEAYDTFLRGMEHIRRYSMEDFAIAIPYLEKAIQLDPNFTRAHEMLMATYWEVWNQGWVQGLGISPDEALANAKHHQKEGLKDPTAVTYLYVSKMLTNEGRYDEAIVEAQRMVALNPNNHLAYQALARAMNKAGRWAEGLDAAKMLIRLDPKTDELYGWWSYRVGEAQYHTEDYAGALKAFLKYTELSGEDEWGFLFLAAIYGQLGRAEEAKDALQVFETKRAKAGHDPYTLARLQNYAYKYPRDRELLRDGLRKAGMPEGVSSSTELDLAFGESPPNVEGATTIDAAEAKALVDRGVAVVDVRGTVHLSTGYIPGAVHLALDREFTEENLSASVAKDEEVVIYADSTHSFSARACARAASWGFEKIYYFRDGVTGWKSAGYPVVVPPT